MNLIDPALTAAFQAIDDFTTEENWVVAATCKGLLEGYHARWAESHKEIEVTEIEKTYLAPLINLKTNEESKVFQSAGVIDKSANHHGKVIFDHKTTSMDISDPTGPYWRQLETDSQPSQYELLKLANSERIDRVIWDVIRKPGIKPKKIAKKDRAEITSLQTYHGVPVSEEAKVKYITEEREDAELYQIRVALETKDKPDRYFARRSVPRTQQQLAEYYQEVWDIGLDIELARENDRHYRNPGSCMQFNSPCKFLGICSGYDSPDSNNWVVKDKIHNELGIDPEPGERGEKWLTNSRMKCFQTCRKKHYYDYELGIERVDAEEKEALYTGSCFHKALDAWWTNI